MGSHRVQDMMKLMASKIRSIANTISDEDAEKILTVQDAVNYITKTLEKK